MRRFLKFFLALTIGHTLFYYVVNGTGVEVLWQAVALFLGWEGAVILFITFLVVLTGALRWREILRFEKKDVSLLTTMRYLIKGFTVDFLTPFSLFGGETVRIMLMEKEVGFKRSFFSTITDKVMDVTTHFFFLLIGTLFFIYYGASHRDVVLIYALAVIALLFIILALFYRKILRKKSFVKWLIRVLRIPPKNFNEGNNGKTIIDIENKIISFFTTEKKVVAKGIFFSFLRHFFLLLRVYLVMFFVIGNFNFGTAVAVYGLIILSLLLPLPAAIGGMEVVLALGFATFEISIMHAVVLAIALRGADLAICFVGTILFLRLLCVLSCSKISAFFEKTDAKNVGKQECDS